MDQVVDGGRHEMMVDPGTQKAGRGFDRQIARHHRAERAGDRHFPGMVRQVHGFVATRRLGHVAKQIVDAADADGIEHAAAIGVGQREISHQSSPATYSS